MADVSAAAGTRQARTGTYEGIDRMTAGLWLALAAAVLQLISVASDFYLVGGAVRGAWLGIPHTTQLVLLSGVVTVVLAGLTVGDRSPMRGRMVGVTIAVVALLATLQLVYRIFVPPFGGCLTYTDCLLNPANPDVSLLLGIWIALAGNGGALLGGVGHAASSKAGRTHPNFWVAERQSGMTPWLGLAAVSATLMFVVGFTFLDFYSVPTGDGGFKGWSAWIAIPHTTSLVLVLAAGIVGLTIAAARGRAPMSPRALGATVGVLAFLATARTAYRIAVTPFYAGPAANAGFPEGAQIVAPAWAALGLGVVALAAGIVYTTRRGSTAARASAGQRTAQA